MVDVDAFVAHMLQLIEEEHAAEVAQVRCGPPSLLGPPKGTNPPADPLLLRSMGAPFPA